MAVQLKLPLERPNRGGCYTAATSNVQPLPGVRGAEFRSLVARVLQDRQRTIRNGWCRMNPEAMRLRMIPLQQWLNEHPAFISDAAVAKCWANHAAALSLLAPANNAGRALFIQLQAIAAEC